MKERIKNKLINKTWKKCLLIFLIVFIVFFVGSLTSINYLNDIVTHHHIHSDTITVTDKMYGDNPLSDDLIIVGANNKTYSIANHDDGYGRNMFNSMDINQTYKVTVKEPELTEINQFTHILQVYNVTD